MTIDFPVFWISLSSSLKVAVPSFFGLYKKAAKKLLFVNYPSALPTTKRAILQNVAIRICVRRSFQSDRDSNIRRFKNVLELNDQPLNL